MVSKTVKNQIVHYIGFFFFLFINTFNDALVNQ